MMAQRQTSGDTPQLRSSVKQGVESQFSQVADAYASSAVHSQGAELEMMVTLAQLDGSERILDAGCGPGHTALTFAPHGREVVGLDLSEAMLAQGRRLAAERSLTNVKFQQGDVESTRLADGSLDRIVTRYSAHHWPSPEKALSEFRRILRTDRPRTRLLLADVVSFEDYTTDTVMQAIELLRDPSHVRDHTKLQWLHMLDAARFRAEVAFTWDLRIDFESWVTRMRTPSNNIAMIQNLLDNAPDEVRKNLRVENDYSFTFPCAVFDAIPTA